jgi:hypothetical protein
MLLPSIKFNTIANAPQNINPATKNRILIAAPFNRGPTDFRYIGSQQEFVNTYGSDSSLGSMGFQAAYDQGARQFGLLRVMGRGKASTGEIDFRGISTKGNSLYLNLKFISEPVQRSKQALKADIRLGGTYTSNHSGRYWFNVTSLEDNDTFARVKYAFIPLASDGFIDWTGDTQTADIGVGIDPAFDNNLKVLVTGFLDNIDPSFDSSTASIVAVEPRVWSNTCLDISNLGDSCVNLPTNGWIAVVESTTNRWTVHTNQEATLIKIDPLNTGVFGTIPRSVTFTNRTYKLTKIETGEEVTTSDLSGLNITVANKEFFVKLNADQGLPLNIANGMFVSFDSINQSEPIRLTKGDMWSVRTDAYRFDVNIEEGATPYEISTAVISTLGGKDPIGTVIRNSSETGVLFQLDDSLKGVIGNKFQYYTEIGEYDGEVIVEGSYSGGLSYIQVPVRVAPFIKVGAEIISLEEGNIYSVQQYSDEDQLVNAINSNVKNIITPGTKVDRIEVAQINDGTALVWLNNPVVATDSSIALFSFINPDGIIVTPYTNRKIKFMTGGVDGPRYASKDLYSLAGERLVTIQALYEGTYGNELEVSVQPISGGVFKLIVSDKQSTNFVRLLAPESYVINLADTDADGLCNATIDSKLVKVYFTPKALNPDRYSVQLEKKSPMRLAAADPYIFNREDPRHKDHFGPTFLRGISLEGGYDGPTPSESDYLYAIGASKDKPVHYLLTPGIWESGVIKSALISHAESATEEEGLRFAVLNAPPRITPNNAQQATLGFNTKDATMVAGWTTYSNQQTSKRFNLSPDVLWAGKRATIPYYVQINAPQSSGFISNVFEVDTQDYTSRDSLQIITDARLEAIHRESDTFGIKFLNDRTLSSNPAYEYTSVVLTEKSIRQDIFRMLKQYLSEPSVEEVYAIIEARIDNYLTDLKRGGYIRNFTSANVTENTIDSRAISVDFTVIPTPSIREITINMTLQQ